MATSRRPSVSTAQLQRLAVILAVTVLTSAVLFGGYYYWDRYVHWGDQSPVERTVAQLEQAVKDNPNDPDARVALAEYYVKQNEYTKALGQVETVLKVYPEHEGALLLGGIVQVRLHQPAAAIPWLEKFVALRQASPWASSDQQLETAYYFLGDSSLKLQKFTEAVQALDAALVINPTDADALYLSGLAYAGLEQPVTALQRYQQAVRFVPDFTEAYAGMIEAYAALNQPDYVAYARGMQAFSLKDYATARTHLEFATQALPEFGPAYLGLGLTYEKLGEMKFALGAIQRALEINPEDFAAQQALGRLQTSQPPSGGG